MKSCKIFALLVAGILIISCFSGCDERSHTNPTIDAPSAPQSTGGDFLNSPVYTPELDHQRLPDTIASVLPEKELELYKKVVKTYLDFGNAVEFDPEVKYGAVIKLIEAYCPVIYSDTEGVSVNVENNTIGWTYTSKTKEEHDAAVKAFTEKAKGFLFELRFDDGEAEKAMVLYERLYKNVAYFEPENGDEEEEVLYNSAYSPIVKKKGDAEMLSKAYCYLLNQAGISALDAKSQLKNGDSSEYLMLTALKLDDEWFYADAAEGVSYKNFTRFGFSNAILNNLNSKTPENTLFSSFSEKKLSKVIKCSSDRFFDLSGGANNVVLDTKNDSMIYTDDVGTKWNFTRLKG